MGWIGDTFKALLGFDDEKHAFRDALANAERYVQWGSAEPSDRDLEEALKLLAECPAREAPNSHYAYRRERAAAEAHACMAHLAAEALRAQARKTDEHFESLQEGRRALLNQTEGLRAKVARMEADGSLISAREERRRLEEMEREGRDLPDLGGERLARRAALLAACRPRFQKHRAGAAASLAAMRDLKDLAAEDAEIRDKIAAHMEKTLNGLDRQWKELAAEFEKDRAAAGKPAK